jgi:hypothetical protein
VGDPKQQDLASIDHGPSGLREPGNDPDPISVVRAGNQDWPAQRKLDETVAYLRARATEGRDSRTQKQPDIFAEAVAKVMQEEHEPELFEAPSVLQNQALGIAARFAVATGLAALVALVFVVAFPSSQGPAGEGALSALPTWQSLTSSLFPAPQRSPLRRWCSGMATDPSMSRCRLVSTSALPVPARRSQSVEYRPVPG